ncbi:hypothetical protein PCANC_23841 [Puccinia coronata f. sp. avenae]|uniref:Uncharacterized protein n=1 Tax=Puccinia coronata f. sp. avenae TaxID=200324 RepID=A0A2N5U600_9BASI|nr:hypothetical protein PCANC_23841 [Puccinia coronata f. sp. avenae]
MEHSCSHWSQPSHSDTTGRDRSNSERFCASASTASRDYFDTYEKSTRIRPYVACVEPPRASNSIRRLHFDLVRLVQS